jgi:hypothetical protein
MWGEPEVRNYGTDSIKDSFGLRRFSALDTLKTCIRMSSERLDRIRLSFIQLVRSLCNKPVSHSKQSNYLQFLLLLALSTILIHS